MGRIHHRSLRGDWVLEARQEDDHWGFGMRMAPPRLRFFLTMYVTQAEAQRLLDALTQPGADGSMRRGAPSFEYGLANTLRVCDLEVTEAEAHRITRGEDPRDVVLPPVPDCGYRLRAVVDPVMDGR